MNFIIQFPGYNIFDKIFENYSTIIAKCGIFILKLFIFTNSGSWVYMDDDNIESQPKEETNSHLLKEILIIIVSGILATAALYKSWQLYALEFHTISEMICLFMAIAMFFALIYSKKQNPDTNLILGYGFLMVSVFEIFHIFYFYRFDCIDLSAKYSMLCSFTEALTFFLGMSSGARLKINIWFGTFLTLVISALISIVVFCYPDNLPKMITSNGGILIVIVAGLFNILLYTVCLLHLNSFINRSEVIAYKYISLALYIAIISEFCFLMSPLENSFFLMLRHIYRIVYYYCLFIGIFESSIDYPYKKMEGGMKNIVDILNNLKRGIIEYDGNHRAVFANSRAEEILKCRKDAIYGLSVGDMIKKFSACNEITDKNLLHDSNLSGVPLFNNVMTLKLGNGDLVKLKLETYSLSDGGFIISFNRAEDEQALENLQLQTHTILDSASSLIFIINKEDRIVMCNKAAENLIEMPSKKIVGMELEKLSTLLHLEFEDKDIDKNLNNMLEAHFTTLSGSLRKVIYHLAPIYNVNEELIGNICIASDITDLKEQQQKLQRQEKFAMIGQLSSGIVHDIKNPLAVIKGFSQVIESTTKDDNIKGYVSMIENASEEINKNISGLLSFSKPRPEVLKEIPVNNLLESVRILMQSYLNIKQINTVFDLTCEDVYITADESKIKEAMLNIIGNAVDAVEDIDKPIIKLSSKYDEVKKNIYISINDNGKGISQQNMQKIGTPFFTTKKNGTGLGLSMCYKIISDSGGKIDVESKIGKGTRFTISLPCKLKLQTGINNEAIKSQ